MNGFSVASRPSIRPMARAATWARMAMPRALASLIRSRKGFQRSGLRLLCASEIDIGRPDSCAMRSSRSISSTRSSRSLTTCITPRPLLPMARAMAISSSASARSVGMCSPEMLR